MDEPDPPPASTPAIETGKQSSGFTFGQAIDFVQLVVKLMSKLVTNYFNWKEIIWSQEKMKKATPR
jgi:hypothetical protein